MRATLIGGLVLVLIAVGPARADFVITRPQPAQIPIRTAPAADDTPQPDHSDQPAKPPPSKPQFKTAAGFGDQVPLSFAVKQIVPEAVKVSFGPGADRRALVDWKGNGPWNRVLRAAIKPLGLKIVMTSMAVEIRK